MDMSPAFIAGAGACFPPGQICFDRFHVMKLCGEACDQVRKEVAREHGKFPKVAMWALSGNAERLKEDQRELRESLREGHAQLGRTLRRRWDGILGYYQNDKTSAAIEARSGLLQLAIRRAGGYSRFENFRAITDWIAGKLTLKVASP